MNQRSITAATRRPNLKHGAYTLKKAVQTLGSRALPSRRTALGRELHEWRRALVADLGGEDAVSTQQLALIDLAVRTKLLCDSVDAYVLSMPSVIDKRHRRLWPVAKERQVLAGQLQGLLRDLGLDRRAAPVEDLDDYLRRKAAERESATTTTTTESVEPMPEPPASGWPRRRAAPSAAAG